MANAIPLPNAEAVLAQARAGDVAALEELYRAFETPVYNLARRICRTSEDAVDVMQDLPALFRILHEAREPRVHVREPDLLLVAIDEALRGLDRLGDHALEFGIRLTVGAARFRQAECEQSDAGEGRAA